MIDRTDRRPRRSSFAPVDERRFPNELGPIENALFNPNPRGSRGLTRYELERVVSYLNSNTPAEEQVTTLNSLFTSLVEGGAPLVEEPEEEGYVCCS